MKRVIAGVIGSFLLMSMTASAVLAQKAVIKWGDSTPKSYSYWPGMEAFKQQVEKQVGDKVEVQLFGDGSLGDQKTLMESILMGSIQMTVFPAAMSQNMIPEHRALTLPFIWPDYGVLKKYLAGESGRKMGVLWEKHGLKVLAWGHTGNGAIVNSKREIRTPDDLKGLKIRTMQDPMLVDTINAIGALATPMGMGELYSAVQQGVLDGVQTATQLLYSLKMQEVAKFCTGLNSNLSPAMVLINLKFWNSLPADVQKSVLDASQNWSKINDDYYLDPSKPMSDAAIYDNFKKAGVKVTTLSEGEKVETFRMRTKPVVMKWRDKIGAQVVDDILKFASYK